MPEVFSLSEDFLEEHLKRAEGMTYCGVPFEELSKDELIAVLVATAESDKKQRENRYSNFLSSLH